MQQNSRTLVMINTIFLYIRMMVTIAIGLYTSRLVFDVLGESDFGLFSLVGSIITVLAFLNAGMLQASQRFLSYALGEGDTIKLEHTFWASWYAHIMLGIIMLVVGEAVGPYLVNSVLSIAPDRLFAAHCVLQCSIVTCFVSIISIPYNSSIIAHEKMKSFAYISILESLLKLIIVYILLVLSHDKLILYAVLMLMVQVLIRFIYSIYCHRNFAECRSTRFLDKDIVRRILSFAGWSFMGNFGIMSRDQGTSMILNIFYKTTVINAARGFALQVGNIISTFSTNITMALNPAIVKNYATGNVEESYKLVMIGCRASFYMLTILIIPFFLNIDYVLTLWLGRFPENTQLFMFFIIGGYLIYSMSQPVTTAIQATGSIRNFQIYVCVLMFVELFLVSFILWTTRSLTYAMAPTLIIQLLTAFMRIAVISRMESIYTVGKYLRHVVARCAMVFACAYAASYYIHHLINYDHFFMFLLECSIIFLSTLFIIYVLGLNNTERQFVRSKVTEIIAKVR